MQIKPQAAPARDVLNKAAAAAYEQLRALQLAAQPDKLAAPYGTECVHGFSVLRIFGNDRYAHVGIYRSQLGGNGRKQSLVACVSVAVCAADHRAAARPGIALENGFIYFKLPAAGAFR